MNFLVLPSSYLAGFIKFIFMLFGKFSLQSFEKIKQLFFVNGRILIDCLLILYCCLSVYIDFVASFIVNFLYVYVTASVINLFYSSLSIWYNISAFSFSLINAASFFTSLQFWNLRIHYSFLNVSKLRKNYICVIQRRRCRFYQTISEKS